MIGRFGTLIAVLCAFALGSASARAGEFVNPGYHLPDTEQVRRFISGRGVVALTAGDSLAFPTFGQVTIGSQSHVNWGIGLRLECRFHEGLKGLWVSDGVYRNADGVGANNNQGWENVNMRVAPRKGGDTTHDYFGVVGENLEPQSCTEVHWKADGTPPQQAVILNFEIYGNEGGGALISITNPTPLSLSILEGDLRAAVYVYRRAGAHLPTGLTADVVDRDGYTLLNFTDPVPIPPLAPGEPDDWYPVVFDLSPIDTLVAGGARRSLRLRLRTFPNAEIAQPGATLYVRGCLFYDASSEGAVVLPLSGKGGWNTANLRFDQSGAGGGIQEDTAEAVGRAAVGMGFGDPSNQRVLIVGIGQNINGNGQVQGATTTGVFSEDIRQIVDQYIGAVENAGGGVDQVILLGTHPWGPVGNQNELLRARSRSDRLYEVAVERGWWYIGVPYLADPWLGQYYFHIADFHLSIWGSRTFGRVLWESFVEAAGPWPCEGDADGDGVVGFGDVTEILARWGSGAPFRYARGDANGDLVTDFGDISSVLSNWGAACE